MITEAGHRRRARSVSLATLTKRTRLLCKIWYGDNPDACAKAAADFETVRGMVFSIIETFVTEADRNCQSHRTGKQRWSVAIDVDNVELTHIYIHKGVSIPPCQQLDTVLSTTGETGDR